MTKTSSYVILCLIVFTSSNSAPTTENHDNIFVKDHCECGYSDSNCDCSCRNLGKSSTLPQLPRNLSCPHFSFELDHGNLDSVPPDFFAPVGSVDTFFFDTVDTSFRDFLPESRNESPFRGVTFLREAYVVLLKVKVAHKWNWHSLSELVPGTGARSSVQVMRTELPELTSDFSEVCAGSVTNVRMNQCRIQKLGDRVFAGHKSLADVNLSKNMIREIKRSQFPKPASELKQIVLSRNLLTTVPECMFNDMPALEVVDLTGNPISTLDEDTFSPYFSKILFIGIQDFRLDCNCKIKWLKSESIKKGKNSMEAAICKSPNNQIIRHLSEFSISNLEC